MKNVSQILFNTLVVIFAWGSFAQASDGEYKQAYVTIYKRCEYCSPLAQVGVTAQIRLDDYYGYGLIAENTDNVYRWHDRESLEKLWSLPYGLYSCTGDFLMKQGDGQMDFTVRHLDSCQEVSKEELKTYNSRYQSGGCY